MNRRNFLSLLAGAAAGYILPLPALATTRTFLNGTWSSQESSFLWTGGGEDPLRSHLRADGFRAALAIPRLGLSVETQALLRQAILNRSPREIDLAAVYQDRYVVGDVMVSGNGWVAFRPKAITKDWKAGRSTLANWWGVTNERTGERWEIIVPQICSNLVLTRLGQAVPCVCDPQQDAGEC